VTQTRFLIYIQPSVFKTRTTLSYYSHPCDCNRRAVHLALALLSYRL